VKLKKFQIHLSTVIVLTLLAGLFIGLNITQRKMFADDSGDRWLQYYGWPSPFCYGDSIELVNGEEFVVMTMDSKAKLLWITRDWRGLAIDLAIAAAILSGTAVMSEKFFRRSS
jgi:hypothetical protein